MDAEGGAVLPREANSSLMPVAERFVSINGEGVRAGKLAAFVRFAGCNLACSYCDTTWANEPDCDAELLSVHDIATWVHDQAMPCVTLTGGEPLLQPLLPRLVRALLEGEQAEEPVQGEGAAAGALGFADAFCARGAQRGPTANRPFVEIETNGAVSVADLAHLRDDLGLRAQGRLGFTLDYKLPSSGMEHAMLLENYEYLTRDDTVKFVAGTTDDLRVMCDVIRRFDLDERCAVYVSPVFGRIEPAQIVDFVRERHLTGVTVQLQLHKIIWPHTEKGV